MFQISYNRPKCIGCAYCSEHSPDYWQINRNDGKADLIGSVRKKDFFILNLIDYEWENQQEVAQNCPSKIIQLKKL